MVRLLTLASGFFPLTPMALVFCHVHFDCAGSRKMLVVPGARHFLCQFLHNMAFVTCPTAFRLRRLAQNVQRTSGAQHIILRMVI